MAARASVTSTPRAAARASRTRTSVAARVSVANQVEVLRLDPRRARAKEPPFPLTASALSATKVGTASRSARNLTKSRGKGQPAKLHRRAWPPQGKGGGKGAGGTNGFGAFGQGFGGKGGGAYGMDLSMIDRPWDETFPGATTTAVGPWQPPGRGVGGPAQAAAGRGEKRQIKKVHLFFERYRIRRESEKKQKKNYKRSVSEEADKKNS